MIASRLIRKTARAGRGFKRGKARKAINPIIMISTIVTVELIWYRSSLSRMLLMKKP
jgi:hypothetical protein